MEDPSSVALATLPDDLSPAPIFSGTQMAQALIAYRELQSALDRAMPDQIMKMGDRLFRKKGYWRAVAVAFNLNVEPIDERREANSVFLDGRENFGYLVTYRATARGRTATGDGSCFAVEKAEKFKCPHPHASWPGKSLHFPHESCPDFDPDYRWRELPAQASEHNVRSHAHTRAFNRSVSNLVGFGEVSAEEVDRDAGDDSDDRQGAPPRQQQEPRPGRESGPLADATKISEPQRKRMYAIAKNAGWSEEAIKALLARHNFEHSADVTRGTYEAICGEFSVRQ